MMAAAKALETKLSTSVIHLEIGQPNYPTPSHITEAAISALRQNRTKYCAPSGISELKRGIAGYISKKRGVIVKEEEVVVGPGAKVGLLWSLMSLVDVGDEVVVPDPGFPSYKAMVGICGGVVRECYVGEGGVGLDLGMLEGILREGKVKVVVVNSPGNPTGGVWGKKGLEEFGRLVREWGSWVVSDEIYSELVYEGGFSSMIEIEELRERLVVVDGFSKSFCMTGWRLGFAVMPKGLAERVGLLAVHTVGCTATFTQEAGVAALMGDQVELKSMVEEYRRRRDLCVEGINAIEGVSCEVPRGAFYLWIDVRSFGLSSKVVASRLLNEGLVAVLPGTDFGNNGEGFIRISYVSEESDLRQGIERMKKVFDDIRTSS